MLRSVRQAFYRNLLLIILSGRQSWSLVRNITSKEGNEAGLSDTCRRPYPFDVQKRKKRTIAAIRNTSPTAQSHGNLGQLDTALRRNTLIALAQTRQLLHIPSWNRPHTALAINDIARRYLVNNSRTARQPDRHTAHNADTIKCPYDGCTADLCCDPGESAVMW